MHKRTSKSAHQKSRPFVMTERLMGPARSIVGAIAPVAADALTRAEFRFLKRVITTAPRPGAKSCVLSCCLEAPKDCAQSVDRIRWTTEHGYLMSMDPAWIMLRTEFCTNLPSNSLKHKLAGVVDLLT
jgi:hypothetical protein